MQPRRLPRNAESFTVPSAKNPMHPEVPKPEPPKPETEEDALTPEEQARARVMFESMGMDGEHVSVAETREMLAREAAL